jgi:dipeptidyl aminopeptidase/acylaminoacyl peptidase
MPAGASKANPAPLVVLPHGGPWVRDTWCFDPEVQFLASRGYAVLQPNYRGSAGFSPEISNEPAHDFRRMHDDVTDAARAVRNVPGIDASRIAIMGASFGGYLALTGVAFEPDLYRCAITNCGVFDWEAHLKARRDDWRRSSFSYEWLRDKIGQPGKDREYFAEISPLKHVKDIRVPVLVAHGEEDLVVDVSQSERLVSALRSNDKVHEKFFPDLEGHGFARDKTRFEYYRRVEAFLAKYLAP